MYNKFLKKSTIAFLVVVLSAPYLTYAKIPDDPRYTDQKQMWDQINAPQAWDITTGSKRVIVAIVDTGADSSHEDLSSNIWHNPLELPDNDIDDDSNGFVDDVSGWNFVDNNNDIRTSVLKEDEDDGAVRHGTVIAGIIGAANNNLDGVGLNWNIRIMPLISVDGQGNGSYGNVARAIDYAVANGADIITMSFVGQEQDITLAESIHNAYRNGVVVVAAAGNNRRSGAGNTDEYPVYPVCFNSSTADYILGVGSVNKNNKLSSFSNFGSCVDIYAPGENIFSTERYAPRYGYNSAFGGDWRGTSFSTPFVAGTAALIKSLHPSWSPDKIIKTILDSATTVFDDQIRSNIKILDVGKAVSAAIREIEIDVLSARSLVVKNNRIYYKSGYGFSDWYVGSVPEAKIISIKDQPFDFGKQRVIAALVSRGAYYYFDVFTYPKLSWREFSVGGGGKYQVQDFRFLSAPDSTILITKEYNKKTKQTRFVEYDWLTRTTLRSVTTKESVSSWSVSADGGYVDIKYKQGKKLTNKRLKWYNP